MDKQILGGNTQLSSVKCTIEPGTIVGGNVLAKKLGSGRASSVWMDELGAVAVKIFKNESYDYFENEVKAMCDIRDACGEVPNIISVKDVFAYIGLTTSNRPVTFNCIAYPAFAGTVDDTIDYYRKQDCSGLPGPLINLIMTSALTALKTLHEREFIHSDLAAVNIFVDNIESPTNVVLGDFGSACHVTDIFSHTAAVVEHLAPERVLGLTYTTAADIWSLFTICYELITGNILFDVFSRCKIKYGDSMIDGTSESTDSDLPELEPVAECSSAECSSAECGDDSSSSEEDTDNTNYWLLMLMTRVLGPAPPELIQYGRRFYTENGYCYDHPIESSSLHELLDSQVHMQDNELKEVSEFLLLGLKYNALERITAADALSHPWLTSLATRG